MLLQELSKYTPFVSSSYKNQGYRDLQKQKKKKKKEGKNFEKLNIIKFSIYWQTLALGGPIILAIFKEFHS